MKRICIFFIVFMFILWCCHQGSMYKGNFGENNTETKILGEKTDWENFGLNGKVKEWTRQSFRIAGPSGKDFNEKTKILLKKETYLFYKSGMIAEVKNYNENDELLSRGTVRYYNNGDIAERNYYNPGGEVLISIEYFYNSGGRKTKEIKNNRTGNLVSTSLWEYDEKGNNTGFEKWIKNNASEILVTRVKTIFYTSGKKKQEERCEYKTDGSIHFRKIIHYNKNEKVIKSLEYDSEHILMNRRKYRYNSRGDPLHVNEYFYNHQTKKYDKLITSYTYDRNGNLLEKTGPRGRSFYRYDERGNEKEYTEYNESEILFYKKTSLYNPKNKKTEEVKIQYHDGRIMNTYHYRYNDNGNIIRWEKYNGTGDLLYSYQTEYDDRGNKTGEVKESTEEFPPGILPPDILPRVEYTYMYDNCGNHVKTLCFRLDDHDSPDLALLYEYVITYWEK